MKPTTIGFRPAAAARFLCISKSTAYRLVSRDELELCKIGERSSIITRASIVKFAAKRGIPLPAGF